ncbi:MAG: T9SS type A sorting domain-containing protein [Bacteroidetes bacterium]|nr:T9SS type A sorting domain-containing protein [Bacteroidota bacterium]
MKKYYLILFFSLAFNLKTQAQLQVIGTGFDNYSGTIATVPVYWFISWNTSNSFYTSTGNFGLSAPSYKFGNDSDFVVAPWTAIAKDSVSFFARGNGTPFSPLNELQILASSDSINWTIVAAFDSIPTTGTILSANLNGADYVKFLYRKQPAGGNLAFDDVSFFSVGTSMNQPIKAELIKVFPSPSTGLIYMRIPELINGCKVEVFDILGNKVKNVMIEKENIGLYSVNLSGKSKGLYFVKIQTGDKFVTKRITIIN